MKRAGIALLLAAVMMQTTAVWASDFTIQIIGEEKLEEAETVSLDDIKLNKEISIDEYGDITPTSCEFIDQFYSRDNGWVYSGEEADFLYFRLDILNTTLKNRDYLADVQIKAVYDDRFEFAGWYGQFNYDRGKDEMLKKDEQYAIEPLYAGHYVFGCTLPNAAVNGKKELRLEIRIDGNELTYYVRK